MKKSDIEDPDSFARKILSAANKSDGYRGYNATIRAIKSIPGIPVIVTGDFNEPSHLDWTENYAGHGADRWVGNPGANPLKFRIKWRGSQLLHQVGLGDAYRSRHPDEVAKPGNTWTPTYPPNTAGRRPPGDQIDDRIDRLYYAQNKILVRDAAVIGEDDHHSDVVYDGRWPSDHRAVVAEFEISDRR